MSIRETLLFACQNDPERVLELIALTWDAEKYEKIFENENKRTSRTKEDNKHAL